MSPLDTADHPEVTLNGRRRGCMRGRTFGQAGLPFHVLDVGLGVPLVRPDAKPTKDILLKTRGN
jgi:hypothetical protein